MNKKARFFLAAFFSLAICMIYFSHDTAEAARLGRSRSFGSKPSYQRSAPAPAQTPGSTQTKPGQTVQQQPAVNPSPMGRWGGMFGGLLMGGLIGSLLFGGGHGFTGPGFLDLLLVGGGLFLLFRWMRSRRMTAPSTPYSGFSPLEGQPSQGWGSSDDAPSGETARQQPTLPPGFNADEFLKGAEAMYTRLQASWDKRDLGDIRQFTSDDVFEEINRQAQEDPGPGKTELLMINARIIEARDVDSQTIVSVLYDVLLRETEDTLSKQVRELWHFSLERDKAGSFWVLEGIQQVDR